VSVFHFPDRVFAAVDCRGGAAATSLTDLLRLNYDKYIDGIVFAGGSAYGLEAASGVSASLLKSGLASTRWDRVAIVPGAVVYDFRGRENAVYPDWHLGATALESAREGRFPLGAHGAGRFVHCGKLLGEKYMERAGQGAACAQFGITKIAVFTVVNAVGCVVDRSGTVVLGNRDPESGTRLRLDESLRRMREDGATPALNTEESDGNTTLTLVVTNREMTQTQLQRLAVETHAGMARAIQPFHTSRDGDTLFAVTTGEHQATDPRIDELCLLAAEIAWTAVLNCAGTRGT
jgi:6-aminohexanoate-oligomer endohydrolase